jgi:uncharacterized membrane protein
MYRFDTAARKDPMRKILEAIGMAALVFLIWETWHALYGPAPLPPRIPIHFDIAGNPTGWGSPMGLLLLPAIATVLYLLITVVSQFPGAFNFPVRVTAQNRLRLEALALQMITFIKVELVCFFAWIQSAIIDAVRQNRFALPATLVPVFIGVVFATAIAHVIAMFRTAQPGARA